MSEETMPASKNRAAMDITHLGLPNRHVDVDGLLTARNSVDFTTVFVDPKSQRAGGLDAHDRTPRTGTMWTATAHVITAVIGSGVLSLAWAISQMGWIAGPLVLLAFGGITYYTSVMLADSYRFPHPETGKRNPTYMAAVKASLGSREVKACGILQYMSLFGTCVGYTITTSHSLEAIFRAGCYHAEGHDAECKTSLSYYMLGFGATELIFSQIPNFDKMSWLSIVAAVMSISYSGIGLGLGIAKAAEHGPRGTLGGLDIGRGPGEVALIEKLLSVANALGNMAFAYSFSTILITIQDTLKSSPPENKIMKKATLIGITTTTLFYISVGCAGYAAFGNEAPGDLLTDFGFYEPWWLVDFANACLVVHLIGAYQVFAQPVFAFVEGWITKRRPDSHFIHKNFDLVLPWGSTYHLNLFRLTWRSGYVAVTTLLAILLPFFNAIMGLLGAIGFWPLTIYFPIQMYKKQAAINFGSKKWYMLNAVSAICLLVTLAAAVASIQSIIQKSKEYKPFSS
ncbi:amino acid permease [Marchantia polymorpha subsp. ruderalis]|uniref:Amino acid transporter transmembrane domain-containing protein n=2 Tax=Marchantia polymorpha TaxID=3197 RepID=A0A679DXS5_MARPO|nr:hypothetical protein MARPO_0134s0048 [Marchantia polymorpha]BBN20699.1 hypothetical protein Mp_zg00300 [Marchantia polymorpha subsp. ruderalis]|eukprot:PTQ29840.1 hypothetical protein MARPO_0134s0048 [Marchantia polymorpha]